MIEIENRAKIRVRYAETDKMGVVYNGNYFTYFEVARAELMRDKGFPYTLYEEAGYFLPLLESFASYKAPAYYDDLIEVEARLQFEGKPFLKFEYKVFRDDTLICEGHTLHSFMNAETRRPVKPPKVFLDAMNAIAKNEGKL